MPHIMLGPQQHAPDIDAAVRAKAYNFLSKLQKNDTVPGLHIEPIAQAVDGRVRTGRVDKFWRAVMFKVAGDEPVYVYLGVWPHDDAIDFARRARLTVNPVNGIAELLISDSPEVAASAPVVSSTPAPELVVPGLVVPEPELPEPEAPTEPLFVRLGLSTEMLVAGLGLDPELAELAMTAQDEDDVSTLADDAVTWQGLALLDLSAGKSIEAVKAGLDIEAAERVENLPAADEAAGPTDEELAKALAHPAAKLQFAFIEDNDELRRAIEDGDFAAWRVFLHPEQRRYVEGSWGGSFRLSGGAGTGKTVVLLHRARQLAHRDPEARILLTTFNKTLADGLRRDLKTLDPSLPIAANLGAPGIFVRGVDATVRAVIQSNLSAVADVIPGILGARTSEVGAITDRYAWRDAIASDGAELPAELATPAFFQTEYSTIVLPQRVTSLDQYLKVRRPGRGVPLDRARRRAVWSVIAAYRLNAGIYGSVDFPEAAAIAADVLNRTGERLCDHVLVDEGQDLGPTQWQFLRALVAEGADDLFIAEDSHQRIYGQKVVLGRLGIKIVGRSQRLRLNYRTTAQNLRYAVSVLSGTDYVDLEEQAEDSSDYRSARRGPLPRVLEAPSLGAEYEQAADVVTGWLFDSGTAPETVGLLVRTEQSGDQLVRALEERGVTVRFVQDKSMPSGTPVVMTMHRAKGMEFARVLIFGADASAIPAVFAIRNLPEAEAQDAIQREKSLLYVAATRARDELVILWTGEPSALLPAHVGS